MMKEYVKFGFGFTVGMALGNVFIKYAKEFINNLKESKPNSDAIEEVTE